MCSHDKLPACVIGGQPSQCGECYQVKVDANGYKQLIVQVGAFVYTI